MLFAKLWELKKVTTTKLKHIICMYIQGYSRVIMSLTNIEMQPVIYFIAFVGHLFLFKHKNMLGLIDVT
jgi:hypothetical protein